MGFWASYLQGWKKGLVFNGRATRKEFWAFVSINYAVLLLTPVVIGIRAGLAQQEPPMFYIGLIYTVMSLVLLLPTLAVGIRRMHDIGRTGWWFGIAYLLPLLNRLLSVIAINYASPSAYVYINMTLSVVLFWVPVILVITLCCFKSKNIPD